jgi:hypothetical protein
MIGEVHVKLEGALDVITSTVSNTNGLVTEARSDADAATQITRSSKRGALSLRAVPPALKRHRCGLSKQKTSAIIPQECWDGVSIVLLPQQKQ